MIATMSGVCPDVSDASLQRILREHAPMCQRMAAGHEADAELARDLVQDILVAVWRAWPAFKGQCSERTYVARIAQYRIATHVSRAVREPRRQPLTEYLVAPDLTPEAHVLRDDAHAHLSRRVRELPLSLREVAILMLEGFPAPEIAATLGISANAVAIRATRARELLRAAMEPTRE
jgi:RNA polymerase sigma-70 factor (ECF subfamily)